MAKIIKLPSGISLDMEQGEIRTALGRGPIPINRNAGISSSSYRRISLWDRFDNFIGSVGNWFADYSEKITSILTVILFACGAIPFIIWLFSLGWWGIVAGIFLSGIAYYALIIVVGVFIWTSNMALGIVRYIFYSGTTFVITTVIVGMLSGIGILSSSSNGTSYPAETEHIVPSKYYCTARSVLNVRSAPNPHARIMGVLKPNQTVDVYDIINGFARIKYNNTDAYASIKYLKKQY